MFRKVKEVDKDFFLNHPVLNKHFSLLDKVRSTFLPEDEIIFIKAPGRVNLIGEHTDYNMGPVLPCAIDKEIVFCIRPSQKSEIRAENVNADFKDIHFSLEQPIEPYPKGHWGNYIKAGVKGIVDYLNLEFPYTEKHLRGYDIIVSSTLLQAAGLSSSSALVVASAFSFVILNRVELSKLEIAEICAGAEHFVGTAGGGMDQAASLLGKENTFLKMEFNPLRVEQINAPKGIQLVLFHSLVKSEKSGRMRDEYNRRVLECRMGVDLFNQFVQNELKGEYPDIEFIGEVKPEFFNLDTIKLDHLVKRFLNQLPDAHNMEAFISAINLTENELNQRYQAILRDNPLLEPPGGFKIKTRFRHVYTECQRVGTTVNCLRNNNLDDLGNLINQSHNSLSQDYEVSTPEVDELVNVLRENGASGARIMGAGFGGMVLAFTEAAKKEHLIKQAKKTYYHQKIAGEQNDFIFPSVVANGAGLL